MTDAPRLPLAGITVVALEQAIAARLPRAILPTGGRGSSRSSVPAAAIFAGTTTRS